MSQQGGSSEIEDYPRSQRIFPGWRTVWIVVGFLVVLATGVLYLGREVARIQLTIWAKSTGKSVAKATYLYASDNDDVLPLARNWETTIDGYWKEERKVEHGGWSASGRITRFAMNGNLSGVSMKTIKDPSVVPIFFLSHLPGPSAVGGEKDVAYDRHDRALVSFTDTHIGSPKRAEVSGLQWTAPVKSPAK
jgi:hypothetical protein